jgi:anti-sigma regulatory factor (Ser/Thr protein kinase)
VAASPPPEGPPPFAPPGRKVQTRPVPPPSDQDERPVRPVRPGQPADPASGAGLELRLVLGASWVAPSLARERVEAWLRGHQWPPAQVDELVLAVSEAVSNSVEHGYRVPFDAVEHPGRIELRARLSADADGYRRVGFRVRDAGIWREPDRAVSSRGHGMLIMRTCTDELVVDGSPEGTTVELRSRPAPPAP